MVTIDAKTLTQMFISAYNNLDNSKEDINVLNVFPVPDGDTGTNMSLTMRAAVTEIKASADSMVADVAKRVSDALLRGARGNSGVITSLLFRGFAKGLKGYKTADARILASAFTMGVEAAYKAVMKPTEGTILTVARESAAAASRLSAKEKDIKALMRELVHAANVSLDNTPELLPVLKQAGVVDSGGKGLVTIYEGMLYYLENESCVELRSGEETEEKRASADFASIRTEDIKFGYCTEFIIMRKDQRSAGVLSSYFQSIGDSVVVVDDDEIIKVHLHTNHPGRAIEHALEYGPLTKLKIDNLKEQHQELIGLEQEAAKAGTSEPDTGEKAPKADKRKGEPKPKEAPIDKDYGFVAVCAGDGFAQVFTDIGADFVVSGGQTMNPSTQDILTAVRSTTAKTVFVFPNNKNIIMAAMQAVPLSKKKKIIVIPTTTIPQGITAMLAFDESSTAEENEQAMTQALKTVVTGQVTFAVRDSDMDGLHIKKGEYLGLLENQPVLSSKDLYKTVCGLIDQMGEKSPGELLTVYYGEDVSDGDAEKLTGKLSKKYADKDVNMVSGKQPVYYFVLALE